jgi:hypothetical protein
VLAEDRCEPGQHPARVLLERPVAGQGGEAQQPFGGERVLRRGRVVEEVLGADDERLGVAAGGVEATALVVVEQPEQVVGALPGGREPRDVVDLREREVRLEQRGVVLRHREVGAPAVRMPRAQPAAVVPAQRAIQERHVRARGVHPVGPVECGCGLCE